MKKFTILLLATGMLGSLHAHADATYYVAPQGNDTNDGLSEATAFRSISKAVKMLKDGDPTTIILASDATFDVKGPEAIIVGSNKKVTFKGDNTVITSGDKEYLGDRIASIGTESDARFEGITFTNGCTRDGIPGGAIFFEGNRLEVERCTFSKNEGNNSAGAIASRGKDVIINNCVFDANRVFGGYGCGAVLYHCGLPNAAKEKCSLIIRNSSFTNNISQNDTNGDLIGFMHFYRGSEYTHKYSNVTYFELANCLFKDNTAGSPSTSVRPRPSDICTSNVRDDFEMNLVNNTFFNSKVLAFQAIFDTPWRLVNNVFYNKETFSIISEYATDERDPLIAYNNVFVGDFSNNLHIDDPCLTNERDLYSNVILPASSLADLGLAKRVSDEGSYAKYLAITDPNSILIDNGMNSSADNEDFTSELIPATDITGKATIGTKDIGCFEYGEAASVKDVTGEARKLFGFEHVAGGVMLNNYSDKALNLHIMLVDGRTIYSANVKDKVFISPSDLEIPNGLLIMTADNGTTRQTVKTVLF